ncbi:uncharacterized protein LOC114327505 isoform X2 [Diabrotica virgifera virgifera]|uniref:Uncharacterized protein n=1 Tax=Diabrotica virgifera virgifera TaxID=50390 RepID=A0ABM5KNV3_DIAVI|nr:uncharacterized protein LOC114327505 isoform X2 [Diabrotica virgifera virgifera]XP_050511872.1 uncharacterized protein LOC114327505 isoform X2 [Diabrotica virgifera virgifera]
MKPLLFLLKLAWDCRYRLPLLITVGFMVLDVRMQLDINVQTRRIPRRPPPRVNPVQENDLGDNDNSSNESWSTVEVEDFDVSDVDLYS